MSRADAARAVAELLDACLNQGGDGAMTDSPRDRDFYKRVEKVLARRRPQATPDPHAVAARVRAGRDDLLAYLREPLLVERIVALAGPRGGRALRDALHDHLNRPFGDGEDLTPEFLTLLVCRIQRLEEAFERLALALAELAHQAPKSEPGWKSIPTHAQEP